MKNAATAQAASLKCVVLERRLLRLSIQVHRRGFMMDHRNLREIVERRLVRKLFGHWAQERRA